MTEIVDFEDELTGLSTSKDARNSRMKKLRPLFIALAVIIVLAAIVVAWWFLRPPAIDDYAQEQITFIGLEDEAITLTPEDLAQMDCQRATAEGSTAKAGTVTGYGPTLEDLLAKYGKKLSDVKKIRITCKDDYYQILRQETLEEYEVTLAISKGASGKDALYEAQQPLRFVIPGADSALWAYGIKQIEIVYTWDKDSVADARQPSRTPQSYLD